MLKSKSKGAIAELKVQIAAHEKNFTVSKPISDYLPYDLIIDNGKKLLRTQIKYCNRRHGNNLELLLFDKQNGLYTSDEIDLLLVYCPAVDQILSFKQKDFHNKKQIQINIKNPKSKKYYSNYLWL